MKAIPFNKNIVFSILLALIVFAIVNRIVPPHVSQVFDVVISKNRVGITDIHQARDIEMTKTVKIDRINLADKSRFRHPKLGDIGYSGDFFVDIDAPFTVKKPGDYIFFLGSDDGFAFSVDGKQLCEWTHDRPLTVDPCRVNLTEGKHTFKLVYFQGYGNAGLTMAYAFATDGKQYLAGDDSKYISF
ncbi:MAG: serine protease [Gammaproteobacteria bacterium]|nr:MAG: serine protease [Gammaproteobacteria bacterium]